MSGVCLRISRTGCPVTAGACSSRDRRRPSSSAGVLSLFLCLYLVSPVRGADVDVEMVRGVEDATSELSGKFAEFRRDVLGAEALATEYERVGFDYSSLNVSSIISTSFATGHIDGVVDIVESVSAGSSSDSDLPRDCCEGSSRQEVCCHGCDSLSLSESPLFSAISDALSSDPALADIRVELEFGHHNGTLLRYPTPLPPSDCSPEAANLQPWFNDIIRYGPLEVVLVIDLNNNRPTAAVDTAGLRAAAVAVLDSLTRRDHVQVVLVAEDILTYNTDESGSNKVLSVCPSNLEDLRAFVRGRALPTAVARPAAYIEAFTAAFNLFNNNTNDNKLILFFSSVSNFYVTHNNREFEYALGNVTQLNAARRNRVAISAYYNNYRSSFIENLDRLTSLVNQAIFKGTATELTAATDVRAYYDVINPIAVMSDVTTRRRRIDRYVNSRGDPSLGLTFALLSGGNLVGFFHALLPWDLLFPEVEGRLESGRGNSHFFVVNHEGKVMYHPLVPGDFQSTVPLDSVESPALLTYLSTQSPVEKFTVEGSKMALEAVSVRSGDGNAFISREISVTYTCEPFEAASYQLFACVGIAQEDLATAQLKTVDIESLYSDSPDRLPLYHTSSIPDQDQCFYFCSISSKDRLSVQLTTPSKPPADVQLDGIVDFLQGSPDPAPWAEEGVPNELGVVSVIGNTWTEKRSNMTDYVVRRHLATPSGVYVAYPFVRLSPDFVAPASEWFVLSSAHPHTLTLTPPRPDVLWGAGHILSAGVALSAPPQDGGGGLLAVVAADLTLPALRALVEDSLPPVCDKDDYSCFLLDDRGNLLYHDILFLAEFQAQLQSPAFFVRPDRTELPEFREMLFSILNESVALKLRCIDYLDQDVRQRLFISFVLGNDEVHAVNSNGIEYAIQHIPDTNAFLGIVHRTQPITRFCFCTETCQSCNNNEGGGCECPCQCPEDCNTPHSFPACPAPQPERDQLAPSSSSAVAAVLSKSDVPDFCLPLDCSCKTEENDCAASRDCHWCPQLGLCSHVTECCGVEDTVACCSQPPFSSLPSCMPSLCTADIDPPKQECVEDDSPTGDDITASIVGGVLGALLVVFLVVIGVAFFLWAKYCKRGLYEDEQQENNFDFSNSKPKPKKALKDETKAQEGGDAEAYVLEGESVPKSDVSPLSGGDTTL